MNRLLIAFLLASCIAAQISFAQQIVTLDDALTFVRYHADYRVNADGTATIEAEVALSPNTRAAIAQAAQVNLQYQEATTALEITRAYTQKKDGGLQLPVTEDKIITRVPRVVAQAMRGGRRLCSDRGGSEPWCAVTKRTTS